MIRRPSAARAAAAVLFLSVLLAGSARAQTPIVVAEHLTFPAGIAFDSKGTMFVTERPGRIFAFGGSEGPRAVASLPTTTTGESGLLGIAVSPDDLWVYAFGTELDGSNTIWRVKAEGGRPQRVVRGLPGGTYHNGGGVAFGPDGMLYVSNGEIHAGDRAQDPNVLGGKVYRYTPDGTIPDDNPFANSPAFAIGLRNPFGLAIDPVAGAPFVTENGPSSFDEINRIVAGGNYGWPDVSGPTNDPPGSLVGNYQDPIVAYEEIIVPTGIAFADPANARMSVAGNLFFATYGDQTIHQLRLNEARDEVVEDTVMFESREPIVALAWGPRGLYFSTPGAIKVFPLARDLPAHGTDATAEGGADPLVPASSTPTALLIFGVAGAVLLGALLYAFGKRRGRA